MDTNQNLMDTTSSVDAGFSLSMHSVHMNFQIICSFCLVLLLAARTAYMDNTLENRLRVYYFKK